MGTDIGLLITADQWKQKAGGKERGGCRKADCEKIKFPRLIYRSTCREVKVKANPAVRGARIKVFEIWIHGLSGSQYQGLSIISVDRRSIPLPFYSPHLQGDFSGSAFMGSSPHAPNDMVGAML